MNIFQQRITGTPKLFMAIYICASNIFNKTSSPHNRKRGKGKMEGCKHFYALPISYIVR